MRPKLASTLPTVYPDIKHNWLLPHPSKAAHLSSKSIFHNRTHLHHPRSSSWHVFGTQTLVHRPVWFASTSWKTSGRLQWRCGQCCSPSRHCSLPQSQTTHRMQWWHNSPWHSFITVPHSFFHCGSLGPELCPPKRPPRGLVTQPFFIY